MAKQPKAYRSLAPVYTGGVYYKPGETFVTDQPKGADWERIDPVEKVAAEAADPARHDDVNLDALTAAELKGHAASLGISTGAAASKEDLITTIKAVRVPGL